MAASKENLAPSRPSSVYSSRTTSSLYPQTSLHSASENALGASHELQTNPPRAEGRQTGDEGEISDGQQEGRASPPHSNMNGSQAGVESKAAGVESKAVNGEKSDGQGTGSGHFGDGEIEGAQEEPSSFSSRLNSALNEDLSEGDETSSSSEYDAEDVSESFEAGELELIEDALKNIHRQGWRGPVTKREPGSVDGEIEEPETAKQSPLSSNHGRDLDGIARLLRKVQAVRGHKREALLNQGRSRSRKIHRQGQLGGEGMDLAVISQIVQAASQAALAAAKSTDLVVSSVNRNSQAIEELCRTLTSSSALHVPMNEGMKEVDESEEEGSAGSSETSILELQLQQTQITKSLVRQNRITHLVLGFMVVTTLIWRYGVVKFVKKISNTVQNPFQGVTDMFDGMKDNSQKDPKLPRLKLPSILTGEDDEKDKNKNKDAEQHRSDRSHASKDKEDNFFNLGNILPGQEPDRVP